MSKHKKHLSLALFFVFFLILEAINISLLKTGLVSVNSSLIFGMLGGNLLAIIISILLISFLYLYLWLRGKVSNGLILLVSGAFVNVFDRLIYGGSFDYLHLGNIVSFNLADCLIILGISMIALNLLFSQNKKSS